MTRKSPIRHKVRSHTRNGKPVRSFVRGSGTKLQRSRVVKTHTSRAININFVKWDISQKSRRPMKTALGFNFYPKELEQFLRDKIVYTMPYEEEYMEQRAADTRGEEVTIKIPTGDVATEREEKIFGDVLNILKDESNWKRKTHYAIVRNRTEADLVARGIKHFTGGAEIYALSDGTFMVGSKGYYYYTGA